MHYIKIIIFILFSSLAVFAQKADSVNNSSVEKNLIEGVKSPNTGLKISSSYYLGELKSDNAVIPLMKVLKSDSDPSARIMAAISLCKIGNPKGIFAISQAAKFDEDDHVRKMCSHLMEIKNNPILERQNNENH